MPEATIKKIRKKRKSPNGEGCITRDKRGYWGIRLTIGYDSNGKMLSKYFTAKSQEEVLKKRDEYKEQQKNGCYVKAKQITVGEWLDDWYENYVVGNAKTPTRVCDESTIRNHLKPSFGRIKLQELKGYQVQLFYNELAKNGRVKKNTKNKKQGLSSKTIKNIHIVFHRALEQAVKNEILVKNPLKNITLPKLTKKEIEILTLEEQKKLVALCSTLEHRWHMGILLALYSGMRRGELLGLTWKDIDFEKNCITINKQVNRLKDFSPDAPMKTKLYLRDETKTSSSNRVIAIAPVIMEKLKEHKKLQNKHKRGYKEVYNDLNMVFCRADGNLVDPDTFRNFYAETLKKVNIGHKSVHALRHTFATRALEANANIKVVSEILGHASVQITLDTYSHVLPSLQQETMQKIADCFF